jgi:hypothetical protein
VVAQVAVEVLLTIALKKQAVLHPLLDRDTTAVKVVTK